MTDHEALRLLCKLHQPDIAMTLEELDAIRGRAFAKEPAEQPPSDIRGSRGHDAEPFYEPISCGTGNEPKQSGVCPDCGWKFSVAEASYVSYAGHLCPKCGTPLKPAENAGQMKEWELAEELRNALLELGTQPHEADEWLTGHNCALASVTCARVVLKMREEGRL